MFNCTHICIDVKYILYVFVKKVIKMFNIKNEIKAQITRSGYTMTQLVELLNEKYNKKATVQSLSNKLARGTISFKEVLEIADVLGYKIEWIKK